MAQRFNPPPGWQVPAGFTPMAGWQPDPSWPEAPAGWNFWVDDASYGATASQPGGYDPATPGMEHPGSPGMQSAGTPGVQGAGTPGVHGHAGAYDPAPGTGGAGAYGSGAYGSGATTGQAGAFTPSQAGAFDPSQAVGGASLAVAQQQVKAHKRTMLLGFGIALAAVLVTVVSFAIAASSPTGGTYYFPWYFGLLGLALGIRGAIMHRKAKKELTAAQAAAGGGLYGSGMGRTDLPGSGGSPNGDLYR